MLVITLGDPYSITQQCLVKLAPLWSENVAGPVVFIGSYAQWQRDTQHWSYPSFPFQRIQNWAEIQGPGLYFLAIESGLRPVDPTQMTARERGELATRSLQMLAEAPEPSRSLAVLTAPIDKHACALAGFKYPGQTEYFEQLWGSPGIMLLAGPRLRVALATNHLPLAAVSAAINQELILQKLKLLDQTLREIFRISAPRLGLAALNPHAGDGGMFGAEDQLVLAPAAAQAVKQGMKVSGPLPADTVFFQALEGQFDAVLAMYHDQGLGPLKTVHFYDAVNITGGLPALRLSPDHGPAANLYGKQEAREDSFRLALEQARRYLGW